MHHTTHEIAADLVYDLAGIGKAVALDRLWPLSSVSSVSETEYSDLAHVTDCAHSALWPRISGTRGA